MQGSKEKTGVAKRSQPGVKAKIRKKCLETALIVHLRGDEFLPAG